MKTQDIQDLYLLSPELSVAGLAILLLVLDLFIRRKGYLPLLGLLGLAVPLGFSVALWAGLDGRGVTPVNDGILSTTLAVDKFSHVLQVSCSSAWPQPSCWYPPSTLGDFTDSGPSTTPSCCSP